MTVRELLLKLISLPLQDFDKSVKCITHTHDHAYIMRVETYEDVVILWGENNE
jgi:hypothetical protein